MIYQVELANLNGRIGWDGTKENGDMERREDRSGRRNWAYIQKKTRPLHPVLKKAQTHKRP